MASNTIRTPYVTDRLLAQIRACKAAGMKDPAIVDKLEPRFDRVSVEHALTFTEFKSGGEKPATDKLAEKSVDEDLLAPAPKKR